MESSRLDTTGLTPTELAYFAGFLDGEGCFAYYGSPRLTAVNTYLPVLKELQVAFGGTWMMRATRKSTDHRTCYSWSVHGDTAVKTISALLPYLREKRGQAQLVLEIPQYPARSAMRTALVAELSKLKRIDQHDYDAAR